MPANSDRLMHRSRRRFLASSAAAGAVALAGCAGSSEETSDSGFGQIGSGRADRPEPGGTSITELPDLEGELEVYSGRSEFLVGELISSLEEEYDDFTASVRYGEGSDLQNTIETEGDGSPADVFYTVNAGNLGALADAGRTQELSDKIKSTVDEEFRTNQWVGTSGRARTIPYNTNEYSESDIPDDIMAFPEFEGDLGWAPTYGSCQAFITAMRILEGDEATREWLNGVVDAGITPYADEAQVVQAIGNGEIDAGFANHYYIQRELDGSPDAPLETAFTSADAGVIFNVAGAAVVDTAPNPDLAQNFVRHLLSAEAQEYFAVETFEYPLISGVNPVGDLPTVDELDVPEVDIADLSDVDATIDLMREVEGISI
jgi:iron(III) transport system substrate-binding protein